MSSNDNYIAYLILKYAWNEELNTEERSDLEQWRSRSRHHQQLPDLFADQAWVDEQFHIMENFPQEEVRQRIMERIALGDNTGKVPLWRRLINWKTLAAASVIGIVTAGMLYWYNIPNSSTAKKKFHAILTLADDRRIPLDKDTFDYAHTTAGLSGTGPYHQISVDTGAVMRIHIPDGTWVSLDNASTIRYPAAGNNTIRECFLEGQASFKVTPDKNRPFIVHFDGTSIEVLGTTFNIYAYKDAPIAEITLDSGSLRVTHGAKTIILDGKKLRQARIIGDSIEPGSLSDPAVETIMSWQSKDPHLPNDTELKDALHRIALRYGVGIRYKDSIRSTRIHGAIPLNNSLDSTVQIINDIVMNIHVDRVMGDSLIISAKK